MLIKYNIIYKVLDTYFYLYLYYIIFPIKDISVFNKIAYNPKYFPYFENYIGALDRTYIKIYLKNIAEVILYRNQKGTTS